MNSRINDILEQISKLKEKLIQEYEKVTKKYDFSLEKWKVIFPQKIKEYQKRFKKNVWKYIFTAKVRHILSIPFIYSIAIPVIILDLFLLIYQYTAFLLYGIPKVKRKDYIIYDRKYLSYLNIIQKVNCMYCSYVNGLFAYAAEIWGRTEKYWCPVKHHKKLKSTHDWYGSFSDYGDPKWFEDMINNNKCFSKK